MPRPIKILKDIIEQDPAATRRQIDKLLGDITAISQEALHSLSTCLDLLLNRKRLSSADHSIIDLGVRFFNDIRAADILIRQGLIIHAMLMQLDAIEIRVVTEYLYRNPEEIDAWRNAQTLKQRRRFSILALKNKVKDGNDWRDIWNDWRSFTLPNRWSLPAYSGNRSAFRRNRYLGSLYLPEPIATLFIMQLAICLDFLENITSWYREKLPRLAEISNRIEQLDEQLHLEINQLGQRATTEQHKLDEV